MLGGARRRAVLAMLALEPGRVISTGQLIEGVWDEPPETATTALQGHVSQLRRVLGEDAILTRSPGYLLAVDPESVDVVRCRRALERARGALAAGQADTAAAILEEASALWRGEPLADLADAPFARDALPELRELRVSLAEERHEAELALGRHGEAIAPLRELVAREPLRERPRTQLMLALYRSGRQAEALEVYESGRRMLSEELGIEPSEALRQLHTAILRQDPELGAPALAPRRAAAAQRRRRWPWLAGAAGVSAAAAAAVIALIASGGNEPAKARAVANGLVRIDSGGTRAAARLDGTPSNLAAADGTAWVLDADGQTITQVGTNGGRMRTFGTGATPTDAVASADGLWVAQGHAGSTQFPGAQTTSVAHLDARTGAVLRTVSLPRASGPISIAQHDRIAASAHAIWVIGRDGAVIQIDPLSHDVTRVVHLGATAVAADAGGAWVLTPDGSLVRIAEHSGVVGVPIDLGGSGASSLAVGGGAVWVVDSAAGVLERVDPRGASRGAPIEVGAGAGPVAYANGIVWVAQPGRGTVLRVDADERRVAGEVAVGGTPRDIATDGSAIWVSVTAPSATADACGPLEHAPGVAPDAVLAADLPLRSGGRSPIAAMVAATRGELRRRHYRAGQHSIGLLVCDDSTTQRGSSDAEKCRANERAYVADPRIVAELGPYNSPCAAQQLPINGGSLAMISSTNTDPLLTRDRARGAYVRIVATDDRQAQAAVRFLRAHGHSRAFVLDDGDGYGLSVAGYFAAAARSAGLRVLGRATWGDARRTTAIVRRVRSARPDVVWVSGLLDNGAGRVVRSLRRALGPSVTIAGPEGLLPVGRLFDRAGAAARAVLIATGTRPAANGVHPFAVLAKQAVDVLLGAIATSDGTRRSIARAVHSLPQFDSHGDLRHAPVTILRAQRPGGSRTNMSLEGGRVVAVVR
jgi:DNA-binding SARP family transcriptional activator/ABC-type branched-subunit amino acid transport system substrate-binding protein